MTRASGNHAPVVLDVLGRRLRIDAGGHVAAAQVEALWSRCRPIDQPAAKAWQEEDPATVITLPRTDRALGPETTLRLADEIRTGALAAATDRLLLLDAAGVATPGGAVLGLLADAPELRSAVAAELSRRGFGYVTDQLLALDESFDVTPFPQPIAFDRPGEEHAALAGPDALGLRPCPNDLHLTAVVLLDHDPSRRHGAALARVRRPDDVRLLESVLISAPAAWAATALPDLVDEVEGLWVLHYGEIHHAAPVLAELLVERTRPASGPTQLYVAVGVGDQDGPRASVSGHDLALDGLRRTVWMAAAGGATLEALHDAANRELAGRHHISVQLVAAAVRDLMAFGLLVPETGRQVPDAADLVEGVPGSRR